MKMPESTNECFYFTNRILENDGSIIAWVYKPKCPECGKGIMGKPINEKTGKVKSRAKIYVCSECNHEVDKDEFDKTLSVEIQYTCPHCGEEGKVHGNWDKPAKKSASTVLKFRCEKCSNLVRVSRMKKKKKKKTKK